MTACSRCPSCLIPSVSYEEGVIAVPILYIRKHAQGELASGHQQALTEVGIGPGPEVPGTTLLTTVTYTLR